MRTRILWAISACLALCNLSSLAQSNEPAPFKAAATSKFANSPNLPSCASGAVQDGDPGKGPSVILIRFKAGCVIPWHWHTPNERLIVVTGSSRADMKDMKPIILKQGDFLLMSSKQIHKFTAITAVELFDISDTTFDIHYVDATGKEIPVGSALKPEQKPVAK